MRGEGSNHRKSKLAPKRQQLELARANRLGDTVKGKDYWCLRCRKEAHGPSGKRPIGQTAGDPRMLGVLGASSENGLLGGLRKTRTRGDVRREICQQALKPLITDEALTELITDDHHILKRMIRGETPHRADGIIGLENPRYGRIAFRRIAVPRA